jgi:hypothetical protein
MKKEMNDMTKSELKAILAEGLHLVEFFKKSGERTARILTLDPTHLPEFSDSARPKKEPEDYISAWDFEKGKWLALNPNRVISSN